MSTEHGYYPERHQESLANFSDDILEKQTNGLDVLALIPTAERLLQLATTNQSRYQNNYPFPHITFDNFLPAHSIEAMHSVFPKSNERFWIRTQIEQEKKLASSHEASIPKEIRNVLYAMNSATFLTFLEELTGIKGLIPDPYFNGGGMHQTVRGGKLGLHIDFNKYPRLGITRCLNVLVYLNKDWKEEFGGHLELWDKEKNLCIKKVLPVYNRCAIFSTSSKSYHGHPEPLTCPEGVSRRSIALYYYVAQSEPQLAHGTVWFEPTKNRLTKKFLLSAAKSLVRDFTPPIVYRFLRYVRFSLCKGQ